MAEFIAQTQATLGTIVTKPKLTDGLLKKPPFRFLHDVVSEVTRQTGFADGLFGENMRNSKAIKDKETKIAYLVLLIDCVGLAVGRPIAVAPKKIVAGHEPENTNALLHALYEAATGDGAAAVDAVRRARAGEKPKAGGGGGGGGGGSGGGRAPKASPAKGKPSPAKQEQRRRRAKPAPEALPPEPELEPGPEPEPEPEPVRRREPEPAQETRAEPAAPSTEREVRRQPEAAPRSSPAKHDEPMRSPHVARARPSTARRAPPKVKTNEVTAERANDGGGGGGGGGGGPAIIGDSDEEQEDDDDGDIVLAVEQSAPAADEADGGEHGILMRNIMAAQEDLEKGAAKPVEKKEAASPNRGGTKKGGIVLKRGIKSRKENVDSKDYSGELKQLGENIQALCQSTDPLAKVIDCIQEDLDAMHKELDVWKNDKRRNAQELDELMAGAMDDLQPLQEELAKVEEQAREQRGRINALKSTIVSNDEQLVSMLSSVAPMAM